MIVLNVMLGREIQGSYGIMLAWVNILRGLFMGMASLVSPSLAAFQAGDETEESAKLSVRAVRMQGLLISVPVGVLCGLAGPALNWWLGPSFTFLAPLAWLILVPLAIEGSFQPVFILVQLPRTIPFPAVATTVLGVMNVVLGVVLVKFTNLGMYGIACSVAFTSILRHAIVLPLYVARLLKQPWYLLIEQQARAVIQLGLTGAISLYAAHFLTGRSLPQLVLVACIAGGISACFAILQLSHDERAFLLKKVRRR
jgi:membrane protein EpsK